MEKGKMRRVHAVLLDLHPIAVPEGRRARHHPVTRQVKGVEYRKLRLLIRWSHIGKNQPPVFVDRICAMKEPILQCAVLRLSRGFEDRAVDIKEPAVITAPNALLADEAEFERCAAMRAMELQQSKRAAAIAERNEVLAQYTQAARQVVQFL